MTRELLLDILGWVFIGGVVLALAFLSPVIRQRQVNKAQEKAKKKAEAFGRRMSAIQQMEQNIEQQVNEAPAEADQTSEE